MEEVICIACRKPTGYTTDHQLLVDQYGAVANRAKIGHLLIKGFVCPKCGQNTRWAALTAQELKERAIVAQKQ
ncbi:MAG TPA: hypothetical protein VIL74_08865 [Pyrinomonadaceae bacterium]|jgi:hypothetical protein